MRFSHQELLRTPPYIRTVSPHFAPMKQDGYSRNPIFPGQERSYRHQRAMENNDSGRL
jgi:hypothetical protein